MLIVSMPIVVDHRPSYPCNAGTEHGGLSPIANIACTKRKAP